MVPLKVLAVILLAIAVTKFGHPLRAAVTFGILSAVIALLVGHSVGTAAGRGAASFLVAGVVFWLMDRTQSILLSVVVMLLGVGVLVVFG